jgi:hypothetical protein
MNRAAICSEAISYSLRSERTGKIDRNSKTRVATSERLELTTSLRIALSASLVLTISLFT